MARHKQVKDSPSIKSKAAPEIQPNVLVDAGPLLALIATADKHHQLCVGIARQHDKSFTTTLPALTEAVYFAADSYGPTAVDALWQMVFDELVIIEALQTSDLQRVSKLMRKHVRPAMSFADASLIAIAERLELSTIFTVDRADFSTYKLGGKKSFTIIGP